MKKLYCLAAGLLLAGATLAQPCSTFDGTSPAGNWVASYCTAIYNTDTNPIDGTGCVHLYDDSGGSWYQNTTDYNNLGQLYLNQCLCFDYYLINDGGSGVPFYPTIYLSDGVNTIAFVSSTAVTPGSGWIHVCAPIQHCTSSTLPSNSDGAWQLITGTSCADFNHVLDNVTSVAFPTDITSSPTEEMDIDNVCVMPCGGNVNCHSDFVLDTRFNTITNMADASVSMLSPDPSATYMVDWGDLTPPTSTATVHHYTGPGTYNVCVTEYIQEKVICRTCITFCYGKSTTDGGGNGNPKGRLNATTIQIPTVNLRTLNDKKFNSEGYSIFPNPSKDYADVQVILSKKDKVSIRIIDMYGKTVSENTGEYEQGSRKIRMNTEKLGTGIYTVEINVGGRISTQKISVSK